MTRDTPHYTDLVLDTDWLARLRVVGGESSSSYLARLLTRSQRRELPDEATRSWPALLGELWQRSMAGWTSAAFALAGEDEQLAARARVEPHLWWRADPVHLVPGLDHVRLAAAGSALGLDREDADGLVALLQTHLREQGMDLHAPTATRWYLCADRPWRASGVATDFAAGRDLRHLLATGPDATALLGLATECQMLLADAEVNAARVAKGLPAVNSLWFWGGGIEPLPGPVPWADGLARLLSSDPELRGAWRHARGECIGDADASTPAARRAHLQQAVSSGGDLLVVLDRGYLESTESPAEMLAWLDQLLARLCGRPSSEVRLLAGSTLWRLPSGLGARPWWPFGRRASNLAELLDGRSRADAHPWYSRGLRQPPP